MANPSAEKAATSDCVLPPVYSSLKRLRHTVSLLSGEVDSCGPRTPHSAAAYLSPDGPPGCRFPHWTNDDEHVVG
jgi:hypothetical protein